MVTRGTMCHLPTFVWYNVTGGSCVYSLHFYHVDEHLFEQLNKKKLKYKPDTNLAKSGGLDYSGAQTARLQQSVAKPS